MEDADARTPQAPIKGRGAASRVAGRFEKTIAHGEDDGWGSVYADAFDVDGEPLGPPRTVVTEERARSIISRNQSPDVGFSQSINPYRGCEHGCVYCFARPSHAYLDLSPGLDFETRLFAKTNAAERLREELAKPGYVPSVVALGINTDAYQPIERRYRITRQVLEVLAETKHPVEFVTKSALIERDLDLLAPMARGRPLAERPRRRAGGAAGAPARGRARLLGAAAARRGSGRPAGGRGGCAARHPAHPRDLVRAGHELRGARRRGHRRGLPARSGHRTRPRLGHDRHAARGARVRRDGLPALPRPPRPRGSAGGGCSW